MTALVPIDKPMDDLARALAERVTCKFTLENTHAVVQLYDSSLNMVEMAFEIAGKFQIDAKYIQLWHCDMGWCLDAMNCATRLCNVPQNEFEICEFELSLNKAAAAFNAEATCAVQLLTLDLEAFYRQYHMPDFIVVNILAEVKEELEENVDTQDNASDSQSVKDANEVAHYNHQMLCCYGPTCTCLDYLREPPKPDPALAICIKKEPPAILKRVVVEIVNQPAVKRFVGGFFDTRKNVELHHAITQTGPHESKVARQNIISRAMQTIRTRDYAHATRENQYVQATQNTDLFSTSLSKPVTYLTPTHPTESSIVKPSRMLHSAIVIQRAWRRYLYHRFMYATAAEYRRLLAQQQANHIACANKELQLFVKECFRKTYPKTRDDFRVLVVQIHKWKQAEIKRISEIAWAGPKIALLHNVLNEEIRMLNEIERKWLMQRKIIAEERREKNLDEMGKPIRWMGYNNRKCEIDYLRTQKVRQLVSFYRMFKENCANADTRLHVIEQTLELIAGEPPSVHTRELSTLLDRERTLLGRSNLKCTDPVLKPLHTRQCDQLANIIELYGKGPNTKVHTDPVGRLLCMHCRTVRPITEFETSTRQRGINKCMPCVQLKQPPRDMNVYRSMLRQVQRNERRLGALSSYAFIARVQDMADLVELIWHSQSVLSQATYDEHGSELQMPRWDKGDDWSPWNCVLMTRAEARAHGLLKRPAELYHPELVTRIEQKHQQAKLMFAKMKQVDVDFVESKRWWRAGLKCNDW